MATGHMASKMSWGSSAIKAFGTCIISSFFMDGKNVNIQMALTSKLPRADLTLEFSTFLMDGKNMCL